MNPYDAIGGPAPLQPRCPKCQEYDHRCACPRVPCRQCGTPLWVYHGGHNGMPCLTARVARLEARLAQLEALVDILRNKGDE